MPISMRAGLTDTTAGLPVKPEDSRWSGKALPTCAGLVLWRTAGVATHVDLGRFDHGGQRRNYDLRKR